MELERKLNEWPKIVISEILTLVFDARSLLRLWVMGSELWSVKEPDERKREASWNTVRSPSHPNSRCSFEGWVFLPKTTPSFPPIFRKTASHRQFRALRSIQKGEELLQSYLGRELLGGRWAGEADDQRLGGWKGPSFGRALILQFRI